MAAPMKIYSEHGQHAYERNSETQKKALQSGASFILKAAENVKGKHEVFTIVDYGCADGGNSLLVIHDMIECVRKRRGDDQIISVVYEDLAENDFKSLFLKVTGKDCKDEESKSYYEKYPDVYISAVPISFYSSCVPPNTVQLGFSTTSFHWLSKCPCKMKSSFYILVDSTAEEKAVWKEVAANDWNTILLHRANELTRGGRLVIVLFTDSRDGWSRCEEFSRLINTVYIGMKNDGIITEEEFLNTNIHVYHRDESELRAPFAENSPIHQAGLRLLNLDLIKTQCPFNKSWLKSGQKGGTPEARAHTRKFLSFIKIVFHHTFFSGLSSNKSDETKENILSELFSRMEDIITENPGNYAVDFTSAVLDIEKV